MRGHQNRGIVLIAVLLAVVIMSVMVVAVTSLTRAGIASEQVEARLLATRLALLSGVESGKALILAMPREQRVFYDGTPETVDLGEGLRLELMIRDAAGLADLNRSDQQLIEAVLLDRLGGTAARDLSVRISQWRKDAEARVQPQQVPAAAPPPATPGSPEKTAPASWAPLAFVSVDQLMAIAGPGVTLDLAREFTVFNPTGRINPLAAPDEVLSAVPGIAPADLVILNRARLTRAWQADQDLRQILERLKAFLTVEDASVFMINVRLQDGPGIIPQSTAHAVVLLTETGQQAFRTLSVTGL